MVAKCYGPAGHSMDLYVRLVCPVLSSEVLINVRCEGVFHGLKKRVVYIDDLKLWVLFRARLIHGNLPLATAGSAECAILGASSHTLCCHAGHFVALRHRWDLVDLALPFGADAPLSHPHSV